MPYVAVQIEAWKSLPKTVIGFQRCLTFITECPVTKKTLEVGSNHRGGTKLKVS